MADIPENSKFTSVKERIETAKEDLTAQEPEQPKRLFPFVGYPRQDMPEGLPFRLQDYLELVDWTGRQIRKDKRGSINESTPPILERLNIDAGHWIYNTQHFDVQEVLIQQVHGCTGAGASQFKGLVGTVHSIKSKFQRFGYQRTPGLGLAELLT